jgi:hypothetical protein
MFGRIIPHSSGGRKNQNSRISAKEIKKAKWTKVDMSSFIDGAGKSNWPWCDTSLKQSVKFLCGKVLGIKGFHLMRDYCQVIDIRCWMTITDCT